MLRISTSALCLLVVTLLAACSSEDVNYNSHSTTNTETVLLRKSVSDSLPTQPANQEALNQQLFNIVGESELSETPDDAQAAIAAIDAGANVNARNRLGDTPLLIAVRNGRVNILKALLDKGADVNEQDERGQTALMVAAGNVASGDGSKDIRAVKLLLARGANVNIKDNFGLTALSGTQMADGSSNRQSLSVRQILKKAGAR